MGIKKKEDSLEAFLNCIVDQDQKAWICTVNIDLTIFNQDENNEHYNICYKNRVLYHEENTHSLGLPTQISQYIRGNSITFRIDLDFVFYDFSKNIAGYTDIILEIEHVQLHLNKGELCINSKYFHDHYIVDKYEDTKIQLSNVNLKDVLLLLTTIYPTTLISSSTRIDNQFKSSPISNSSCSVMAMSSAVLELAERWKFHTFHWKVATGMMTMLEYKAAGKQIQKETSDYLIKCIKFGDKYGYLQIVDLAIGCFASAKEVKAASEWSHFDDISRETRHKIFTRLLKLV